MKKIVCLLLALSSFACSAQENKTNSSGVPVSVNHVELALLGDDIVRVIKHNMEANPILQFEIMERPDFTVLETLTISEISVGDTVMNFKNSSGVFIEELNVEDDHIFVLFDYIPLNGSNQLIACSLSVENSRFKPLACEPQ